MKGGFFLLSFFFLITPSLGQKITYEVVKDIKLKTYGEISIAGLGDENINLLKSRSLEIMNWPSFFAVCVAGSEKAILGSYKIQDRKLTFTPRFLPDPHVSYIIKFSSLGIKSLLPDFPLDKDINWTEKFDDISYGASEILGIFPEKDTLPSNLLRLYIQFSEPMGLENPYDFISIEDEEGNILKGPFVEIKEGLWNPDRTRLTLLLHPGRIKRGVGPNMTQGEIFELNSSYSLVLSNEWRSGSGNKLNKTTIKKFNISEPVRTIIAVEEWKITKPSPGTLDKLFIRTDEILDKALAERLVSIIDENGLLVDGIFQFNSRKLELSFAPSKEWDAKSYFVVVDSRIEDVCGNTLLNVFDKEGSGLIRGQTNFQIGFDPR